MEQDEKPQRPDFAAWVKALRQRADEGLEDADERAWVPLTRLNTR